MEQVDNMGLPQETAPKQKIEMCPTTRNKIEEVNQFNKNDEAEKNARASGSTTIENRPLQSDHKVTVETYPPGLDILQYNNSYERNWSLVSEIKQQPAQEPTVLISKATSMLKYLRSQRTRLTLLKRLFEQRNNKMNEKMEDMFMKLTAREEANNGTDSSQFRGENSIVTGFHYPMENDGIEAVQPFDWEKASQIETFLLRN